MIDRLLFLFVCVFIAVLAFACYDPKDPTLPPVYPDYPAKAVDAGRG